MRYGGHTTTMGFCGITNLRKPEYTGICDGRPGDEPRLESRELSTTPLLQRRIIVTEQNSKREQVQTTQKSRKHS